MASKLIAGFQFKNHWELSRNASQITKAAVFTSLPRAFQGPDTNAGAAGPLTGAKVKRQRKQ